LTNLSRQSGLDFFNGFSDDMPMSATKHVLGVNAPEILT